MKNWIKQNKQAFPFLILLIIHIMMFIYLILKKQDKKYIIILLLSNIGLAYVFEVFVLNLFHGYRYLPKIFKNKVHDNILGAFFSQAIYVPIVSTFLTAFQLNWKWKVMFATYFSLIERIFIKLNIFKTKWWRTYYTFFLMLFYFYISDAWGFFMKRKSAVVRKLTEVLSIYSISITGFFISAVFNQFKIGLGVIHTWREHFTLIPIYSLVIVSIHILINKLKSKKYLFIGSLVIFCFDHVLVKVKVVKNRYIPYYLYPYHLFVTILSRKFIKALNGVYTR